MNRRAGGTEQRSAAHFLCTPPIQVFFAPFFHSALLRLPPFVAALVLNLFAAAALSFLDPTVQPFLHDTFGLNESEV